MQFRNVARLIFELQTCGSFGRVPIIKLGLHEQTKHPLLAQICNLCEVTLAYPASLFAILEFSNPSHDVSKLATQTSSIDGF